MTKLERLVREVQREHRERLDLAKQELTPYRWRSRPRPKTAIIGEAAKKAIEDRSA